MTKALYQVGDTVRLMVQGVEQGLFTIEECKPHNGQHFYRLDDPSTKTAWPEENIEHTNAALDAALCYAARGWAVFPCNRHKKPRTSNGFHDATTDLEKIRLWWSTWPSALVGIACGASGLVVIDCDIKHAEDGISNFEGLGIRAAGALTSETPSGGRHFVFTDTTAGKIRNSQSKLAAGVDVRANGGYIIAPPSKMPEGSYTCLNDWRKDPDPLPGALEALLMALQPTRTRQAARSASNAPSTKWAAAALDKETQAVSIAAQGTRNATLNQAAYNLGQIVAGGDLDEATVANALLSAARAAGLPEDEAQKTLESGLDAGKSKPRTRPAHFQHFVESGVYAAMQAPQAQDQDQDQEGPSITDRLLKHGANGEGNAQTVVELYGKTFLHVDAYGWLRWTGTHWEATAGEKALDRAIIATLKARRVAAVKAELEPIVKAAKPDSYRMRDCKTLLTSILTANVEDFDNNPDLLNVQNGVLDLRTGDLTPHDPRQRFTYCCPVDFDKAANSAAWEDWLVEAIPDPETRDYLQEAVGYSLTGHTREEILFYLFGPARAGKGTFTETLLAMLDYRPIADEADFATFTVDRSGDTQNFDLAGLKPCRFIAASESGKYTQLNAAKIKALTGGNMIRCAHKRMPFFTYRPQFKIWLSSNHPVNADVDDDAAWGRLRVVHFPNSHLGTEDKTLKARLREPANLAGVLAWAQAGAARWYARGSKGLEAPAAVQLATRQAREDIDYIAQWLDECIEITGDEQDRLPNDALYLSYKTWCDDNGITPKKLKWLTAGLKAKGLDAGSRAYITTTANQRKQVRVCKGVKLA